MATQVSDNWSKQVWVLETGVTLNGPSGEQGDFYFKAEGIAESVYLGSPLSSQPKQNKLKNKHVRICLYILS